MIAQKFKGRSLHPVGRYVQGRDCQRDENNKKQEEKFMNKKIWEKGLCLILAGLLVSQGFEAGGFAPVKAETVTTEETENSDFEIVDGVLEEYLGNEEVVTIPEGVVEIDLNAFKDHRRLKKVNFPSTLKIIGDCAFCDCNRLEEAIIPEGVEVIGNGAFEYSGISKVTLPSTLKELHSDAFVYTENLKEIEVAPNGVRYIDDNGILYDKKTDAVIMLLPQNDKIYIPATTKIIGEKAFSENEDIQELIIPESVNTIERYAFSSCKNLKKVSIQTKGKISIYLGAFADSENIETVDILDSTKIIPESCLFSGTKWIEQEEKEKGLVVLGGALLSWANAKGKITIPKQVNIITGDVFKDNIKIKEVVIPNNVKQIGDYAFSGCKNLKKLSVKKGTLYIEHQTVFMDCDNLETVNIPKEEKLTIGGGTSASDLFKNSKWRKKEKKKNKYIIVGGYLLESGNCKGKVKIPQNVHTIINDAFMNNQKITEVTIPKNVKSIGWAAFSHCSKLKEVDIKANIKKLDWRTFDNCTSLKKITFPNTLESIAGNVFEECKKLTSIVLPQNVITLGYDAFKDCTSLKSIVIKSKKLRSEGGDGGDGIYSFENINKHAVIKVPKEKLEEYKELFTKAKSWQKTIKIVGF